MVITTLCQNCSQAFSHHSYTPYAKHRLSVYDIPSQRANKATCEKSNYLGQSKSIVWKKLVYLLNLRHLITMQAHKAFSKAINYDSQDLNAPIFQMQYINIID